MHFLLFEVKMKRIYIISLFIIFMCLNSMTVHRVYTNERYCKNTLTLYDNGRADWYDCEIDETFYGHYWQCRDTLFVETFCSSIYHEDHQCLSPRLDIYIYQSDTLLNIGYKDHSERNIYYSDSINYFCPPHTYIQETSIIYSSIVIDD